MKLLLPAENFREAFQKADPFPHIVIDNLFPDEVLEEVLKDFPDLNAPEWWVQVTAREKKWSTQDFSRLSPTTREFLYFLNSKTIIEFAETLTGINHLIPDPHYWGGGLHQIPTGGFLKIHADFNWNNRLQLCRRLNLLVYLNKDWKEEYGGQLELWDKDMKECRKKILPKFNRTVIFATTDNAYHGHPTPMTCPEDMTRKSIALYYYTNGRPKSEVSNAQNTMYMKRTATDWESTPKEKFGSFVRKILPPFVSDIYRYVNVKWFHRY